MYIDLESVVLENKRRNHIKSENLESAVLGNMRRDHINMNIANNP